MFDITVTLGWHDSKAQGIKYWSAHEIMVLITYMCLSCIITSIQWITSCK